MMVPDKTHLYFIALIAAEELAEKIRGLQLYCSETYQSKKALRSPPHVTLIPPFREDVSIEEILQEKLTPFFGTYHSFNVELDGFGKFDSSVIFIDVPQFFLLTASILREFLRSRDFIWHNPCHCISIINP